MKSSYYGLWKRRRFPYHDDSYRVLKRSVNTIKAARHGMDSCNGENETVASRKDTACILTAFVRRNSANNYKTRSWKIRVGLGKRDGCWSRYYEAGPDEDFIYHL